MTDKTQELYRQLVGTLKQIIALQDKRLELQDERHRIMVKKTDRLQSELRSALERLRQLEEMND